MGESLAVLGGEPEFNHPRHVGTPNLPDRKRLLARIEELLDRRWLTNFGPFVREFEEAISDVVGVGHVVATSNGTVAMEIVTRAVGLRGQGIVPAWTFVATPHALRWQEITPAFADADPGNHTMDPASAARMATPSTSGVVAVHTWGQPCDADAFDRLGTELGVPVVYDAAHAFGCGYPDGTMIGTRGAAEVFSFHATKFLNTFEGGAIVTNDGDLAERCRLMSNFGFQGRDRVDHLGINAKMSEVAAAMGITSMEAMADIVAHNRDNHAAYRAGLSDLPGFRLLSPADNLPHNHQYIVVEVGDAAPLTRDEWVSVLEAERVLARRYFTPGAHRMEPYASEQPHAHLVLPVTERLAQQSLVLPTGNAVTVDDVERITSLLRRAAEQASAVRDELERQGLRPRRVGPQPSEEPRRRIHGPRFHLPTVPAPRQ